MTTEIANRTSFRTVDVLNNRWWSQSQGQYMNFVEVALLDPSGTWHSEVFDIPTSQLLVGRTERNRRPIDASRLFNVLNDHAKSQGINTDAAREVTFRRFN